MADLLIRDLSPETLMLLDRQALALGISRVEYVRRSLAQAVSTPNESVTEAHLKNLLTLLPDLGDQEIMDGAWR
jgi:hypothetical protein